MKLPIAIACVVLVGAAKADLPSLSFPSPRLDLPGLSLLENTTPPRDPQPPSDLAATWFNRRGTPLGQKRALSQMPVIKPRENIDPKMVVPPAPGTDYKMLILDPDGPRKKG